MNEVLEKLIKKKEETEKQLAQVKTFTPPQNYEIDRAALQAYINGLLYAIRLVEQEKK